MISALGIAAIVLAIIIIYFFIRMRNMMKQAPGATSKMNTIELIKNWQEQKTKEAQYQEALRERAREAARPEIERALVDKYKQDAIKDATADKGTQFKNKLKEGLGIDLDKAMSQENMDRLVGRSGNINVDPGRTDIFSQDRLQKMAQSGIDPEKLRKASGSLNWGQGAKRGLQSNTDFNGVERALYGPKYQSPPPRRRYGPPPRP